MKDEIDDLSEVEENFNERNQRIDSGEMKPRKRYIQSKFDESDQVSSDACSVYDSKASRINFWKDINIKDDIYKRSLLV